MDKSSYQQLVFTDHDRTINDLTNEKNKLSAQIELYEEMLDLFDIDTLSNSKYNEFYANRRSWVKDYDMSGEMTYFVSIQCRDYEETNHLTKLGGELARSCQAIDQELEKELEKK